MKRWGAAAGLAMTTLLAASAAFAQAGSRADVAEFYAGKTVRIIIGFGMGGGYGQYSQLAAKHIGKYVPGNPSVIVQSMPGAGGVQSLVYVANVATPDGTTLTMAAPNVLQESMLAAGPQYDPARFQWIGRMDRLVQAAIVATRTKARTLADAKAAVLVAGGAGAQDQSSLSARILNDMAGTRFNVVSGYKGTAEVEIAWSRGEVDVFTGGWDFVKARYAPQLEAKEAAPLYVYAMQRIADLPEVPAITEFGRNEAETTFLKIYAAGSEIGRALAFPSGVPKERIEAWRTAHARMLEDPELKAAAQKGDMRLDPLDGEKLGAIVSGVLALPAASVRQARTYYEKLLAEAK